MAAKKAPKAKVKKQPEGFDILNAHDADAPPWLVCIEWIDHYSDTGWLDRCDIKTEDATYMSVGFLVKVDAKQVVLAGTLDLPKLVETNERGHILRNCIKSVVRVAFEK